VNMESQRNTERIQNVLTDDLFPNVQHISDVKQVLEYIENIAQAVSEGQLRAAILLEQMGNDKYLHPDGNPYHWIVDRLIGGKEKGVYKTGIWKKAVAPTSVFLDTLQELIPKPPRPIVVAPGAGKEK
jgi:hypothetical protein